MDRQEIIEELRGIIGDYLKNQGLELIDLIYHYEGRNLILRVLTDKPQGGISLDECARLNNQIGIALDEKGILEQRYILEVSSPGIDRPLRTKGDFSRCINRKAKFYLCEPINGKIEIDGVIYKVEDDLVYVDIEGNIIEIPLTKITKAKQIII